MRLSDRLRTSEANDDYTPTTDLVFSMFAMTVLLLAIFGAGSHVAERKQFSTIEQRNRYIADLEKQIEKLKGSINIPSPVTPPRIDPDLPVATRLEIDQLKRQLRIAQEQYDSKSQQANSYFDELNALKQQARGELPLLSISQKGHPAFVTADNSFPPALVQNILAAIVRQKSDIARYKANEIVFRIGEGLLVGKSKAEYQKDSDMIDSQFVDAITIGQVLLQSMLTTPLPPACTLIEPIGQSRSAALQQDMVLPGAGDLMLTWIRKGRDLKNIGAASFFGSYMDNDRRIDVIARRNENSPCLNENLLKSIELILKQ